MKNWQSVLVFSLLFSASPHLYAQDCLKTGYWIGAAQADITGPIVGIGMMGYANSAQVNEGLHMRLRSRSLVIADACKRQMVAMVIADLGQVFGGVKAGVVRSLEQELPGVFNDRNVLISATHTHSGPGGYAHHALYNFTTLGFFPENFDRIVSGITRSIVSAYRQRKAGRLRFAEGTLKNAQWNRSPEAYRRDADAGLYDSNTDEGMQLLKAEDIDGRPIAAFNWFAVHGVSLPMANHLVSGDNKGLASYYFETAMGATYLKDGEFIAGFVQSNSGDVSPYDVSSDAGPRDMGWARNEASARAQWQKAWELFQGQSEDIQGAVGFAHRYIRLGDRDVDAVSTSEGPQKTCRAALGASFAAGSENGRPLTLFQEGTIYGVNWPKITLMPGEQECQKEKVILLPVGYARPDPWVAPVAAIQILRVGELAVIGLPFEITTMAGRRLRAALLDVLKGSGVRHVLISALANEYLHYLTTREEYAQQAYEGGSTLYGPWSLAAYTKAYEELARAMIDGRALKDEAQPLHLSTPLVKRHPSSLFDRVPGNADFGSVKTQPDPVYDRGARVIAEFWAGHPNHGHVPSYLLVQEWQDEAWRTIRHDWDPDTVFRWRSLTLGSSVARIEWASGDAPAGVYRICTSGYAKALWSRGLTPYSGCSASFSLR